MSSQEACRQPDWKPALLGLVLLFSWIVYWYWGTLEAMAQIWWRSETYAHGLVVPPIALWLVWRRRNDLAAVQPRPAAWFALPLAGFVFCWLLGELTAVNAATQFSVIGIIVLTIVSLTGPVVGRALAFPLLFLFFSVPIGDFLLPQLMEWTADFTVLALRLTGIPVFREGQNFVIPSGSWSVVEACSGIRYLIASLTVGTLYAYLTYNSLKRRLAFIGVALLVPVVANWLRAYLIVMLGHLSGNKLAAGADHLIYGWIFFGIVIATMFMIGMRWAEPAPTNRADTSHPAEAGDNAKKTWPIALLLAALIAAGPVYEIHLRQVNAGATIKLAPIEPAGGSWQTVPSPIDWQPRFLNPSAEERAAYGNQAGWVGLYIAYYQNQDYENKLVTSTNVLVASNDQRWQMVAATSALAPGIEHPVRQAELLNRQGAADDRYIVWQWYWIDGHLTSSDIKAKWLTAWAMLSGHGDDSAAVVLFAPKTYASSILPSFAEAQGAEILRRLAEARRK